MDIGELLQKLADTSAEMLSHYCVINKNFLKLSDVEAMGYRKFALQVKSIMPQKLYRYYPNRVETSDEGIVNHSQFALKNNTVYMSSPVGFDDAYDSEIALDYLEFEKVRLVEYCRRCRVEINDEATVQDIGNLFVRALWDFYSKNANLDGVFVEPPKSEIENLSNHVFCLQVLAESRNTQNFGVAVQNAIQKEYMNCCAKLKDTFRVACFAKTPYSQLMWAAYADCHKGFCVEYTVVPSSAEYEKLWSNLFPVIYCKMRPNITKRISENLDQRPDEEHLWDLYFHGALRKSIDWAYQDEWRLLLPFGKKETEYNISFYPIAKVYLGNKMPIEKRKEIISICKDKGIPYVGVKRNPVQFEMQECEFSCEKCSACWNSEE